MVAYSLDAPTETSVKAKGTSLKIHFKNVVNVAQAIKHMTLKRAKEYLANVLEHKEVVAMNSHKHGRGRHAQVRAAHARAPLRAPRAHAPLNPLPARRPRT
jgi:large subunit ribosomal protein L17e